MRKPCIGCGKIITKNPRYSHKQWGAAKYCGYKCPERKLGVDLTCLGCGKTFNVRAYRRDTAKHCSMKCKVTETYSDGQGYLRIGGTKVRQHRAVMEQHLGRKLEAHEVVHHLNHNKSDNRVENLVVLTRAEHIRVHPPVRSLA